jgi:hypothetical protein
MCLLILFVGVAAGRAEASYIYESATLGTSNIHGNHEVVDFEFHGAKFQVTSTVTSGAIGGHFVTDGNSHGPIFAAVVALTGPSDFPDTANLSSSDVLGSALLTVPLTNSGDISAPLSVTLTPGWYALVYGGGVLGSPSNAYGYLFENDTNLGTPSYFSSHGIGGAYSSGGFDRQRFFLTASPEPVSLVMLAAGTVGIGGLCYRRRRAAQ